MQRHINLIALCLIMLLGRPAQGQSETDAELVSQDTVEIHISGWGPLRRGGAAEALVLNGVFTIGTEGLLDLPKIGRVPAAGLRTNELEKLITYHLQATSGFAISPLTVRASRRSKASSDRAKVEEPPQSVVKPSANGSLAPAEPAATEQQLALERERSKAGAPQRNPSAARVEVEAARGETVTARQGLAAERQQVARLTQELSAARAAIAALKAQMAAQTNAASRARQTAEAREHELVARERGKAAALEQNLLAARRDIDALKNGQQTAGDELMEASRRELAAARGALEQERDKAIGLARDLTAARKEVDSQASAQARAADRTAEQGRALEDQRRKAEGLARDLTLAKREIEGMKAQAVLADRKNAAAGRMRNATEAALAEARQAVNEERQRAEFLERDLVTARQTIDALRTTANLAAAAQTSVIEDRRVAEVAAKRAGEALALEREQARSAARDLDIARGERDAAKGEATRATAALRGALEQEHDKAIGLARDLTAARKEVDRLKAGGGSNTAHVEPAPKPSATVCTNPSVSGPVRTQVRLARESGLRAIRKVQARTSQPFRLTTIILPEALRPTRPAIRGLW